VPALRVVAQLLTSTAVAFALVILLAMTLPIAFGDRTFVVRSGSMTPAIETGDVVAVQRIRPTSARIGDVVTFDNHGKLTSHRVRSVVRRGDKLAFTTQGDANTGQEHWRVDANGRIGRVLYRVPKIGFVVVHIQSRLGQLGMIVLPALLLGVLTLRRIWRTEPQPEAPDGLAS
jgi:signal peptidase